MSGIERRSQDGTPASSTVTTAAGTPRRRKYFCARISAAVCDHASGTSMPSWRDVEEPSCFRISDVETRNWKEAYPDRQSVVKGKSVLVRVVFGGRSTIKKKKQSTLNLTNIL